MAEHEHIHELGDELQKALLLPIPIGLSYTQLLAWLSSHIGILLKQDFSALVQLLYRIDVSEEKLKYLLQQNRDELAANNIAKEIIERQVQKITTRQQFKRNTDIAEDEKW